MGLEEIIVSFQLMHSWLATVAKLPTFSIFCISFTTFICVLARYSSCFKVPVLPFISFICFLHKDNNFSFLFSLLTLDSCSFDGDKNCSH